MAPSINSVKKLERKNRILNNDVNITETPIEQKHGYSSKDIYSILRKVKRIQQNYVGDVVGRGRRKEWFTVTRRN